MVETMDATVDASEVSVSSTSGYTRILEHLEGARTQAAQLNDQAAAALITLLQHLCLRRVGAHCEPVAQMEFSNQRRAPGTSLDVYLLGSFQVFLNSTAIDDWRKKSEALFQYLVYHRALPIHRERLVDLFWQDADLQSAHNCLNVTIHALRRSLRSKDGLRSTPDLIQFQKDHYRLNPEVNVWTDVDSFREYVTRGQHALTNDDYESAITHYELATTLYHGDFLENSRYEDWAISPREQLRSVYLGLLTNLSQLYLATGNYTAALECSQKVLGYDDCLEEAHCQMMRCYYLLGRRGMAIHQYQVCRDTLARELGMVPMLSTAHLYEQIKSGEPLSPQESLNLVLSMESDRRVSVRQPVK